MTGKAVSSGLPATAYWLLATPCRPAPAFREHRTRCRDEFAPQPVQNALKPILSRTLQSPL